MKQTITKIKGLTVNIEVVEISQTDANGSTIWYHAAIYVERRGTAERHLVKKSRLPGAATELKREIERDGLRAIDLLAAHPPLQR